MLHFKINLIQENTREIDFYTSLRDVEKWMEINLEDYDWHFLDVEGEWTPIEDPRWVSGKELKLKISKYDYQFFWAVLPAFPRGTKLILSDKPYADCNPNFWTGSPKKNNLKIPFSKLYAGIAVEHYLLGYQMKLDREFRKMLLELKIWTKEIKK